MSLIVLLFVAGSSVARQTGWMEPLADLDRVLGLRDVVVVEGPDALTYLQSQVSQDLQPMSVGDQRWTFVLEPTGKVDALARVTRAADDRFELDTDAGFGEALLARLDRFKIRVDVRTSLVAAPASSTGDEPGRIALGWPRMGVEIVPGETIPAGTGVTRIAVSFTKGCYPGQELVERMDSRAAEAPRSLRRLTVAEGTEPGATVVDDGAEVGVITSVAGNAALAWVKRSSELGDVVQF
jgi:folate-binding protein YgfZ